MLEVAQKWPCANAQAMCQQLEGRVSCSWSLGDDAAPTPTLRILMDLDKQDHDKHVNLCPNLQA
jgi:hypothetical protein